MELLTAIPDYIIAQWPAVAIWIGSIWALILVARVFIGIIVKMTKTQLDDKYWAKVTYVLDFIGPMMVKFTDYKKAKKKK